MPENVPSISQAFGHLTQCHVNPCVTTCLLILGLVEPFAAVIYFIAEFLGAIFGFYLVLVCDEKSIFVSANFLIKFEINACCKTARNNREILKISQSIQLVSMIKISMGLSRVAYFAVVVIL